MLTAALITLSLAAERPFQDLAFPAALERAAAVEKVVMVDFFTTWCGPCKRLDATTWKDEAVVAWLGRRTVALKLDAEVEVDLAGQYAIRAYPTLLFVRPDGTEIGRLVGYKDPEGFLQAAGDLLAGKSPLDSAREVFEASEKDPSARMTWARALEQAGELEQAAEQLLWCWDHGVEQSPSFSAVRVSFLVAQMAGLAAQAPSLREALHERRERAAEVLLAPDSPEDSVRSAAKDLAALDERFFKEPRRSLELYDRLGEAHAEARLELAPQLQELFVAERRYEDALVGTRDPVWSVRLRIQSLERLDEDESDEDQGAQGLPSMRATLLRLAVDKGLLLLEACAGAGRQAEAREIAGLLIELQHTGSTYAGCIEHAARAGSEDVARELAQRGRATLEGEELERLERAARSLED